ncbi:hypothetical protein LCGC14_2300720, partial [marine sediment metagenome]
GEAPGNGSNRGWNAAGELSDEMCCSRLGWPYALLPVHYPPATDGVLVFTIRTRLG